MSKDYQQKISEAVRITEDLARELERTPLKLELMSRIPRYTIDRHCGGYEKLLSMAGLNPHSHNEARRVKATDNMFRQPVPEELSNKEIHSQNPEKTIAVAGDTHFPWIHEPTLKLFYEFLGDMKPDYILQIGDLYDMYAHSRFPKSQNIYTPKEEEARARAGAEEFWRTVQQLVPNGKCIQLKGNHDIRPVKRAQESYPEMEHFVEQYMEKIMAFDGVTTIADHREILRLEGIAFHHGYLGQLGAHRDSILENTVVGHTHLGGVVYRALRDKTIWELNCGLMGDPQSKVMSYTSTKENKWTLGFGYIDQYGPRFIAK